MHKVITLLSAVALSLGASADIKTLPLKSGDLKSPFTAKVIGIKAVSSTGSGTIAVKEVIDVASSSVATETTTNIVQKGADYRVADAYVGQTRVYADGSENTKWIKWNSVVTNIADAVTNVVTYKLAKWCDNATTNSIVWTNQACSVKYRDVIATAPFTNIVTRNVRSWTHTPYTNDLYSGTLSSGKLDAVISNKFILGGTKLSVSGTAFTGGNAYFILEK